MFPGLVTHLKRIQELHIRAHRYQGPIGPEHELPSGIAHVRDHVLHTGDEVAFELVREVAEDETGNISVDVVVLVEHFGGVLKPGIAQVTDDEAHVGVVHGDVVDKQRMRLTDFRVYVAASAADNSNRADFALTMGATELWKIVTVYDGTLAAASRLAVYAYLYDESTKEFGARQTPVPSITGTIPVSLRASALGYTFGENISGFTAGLDGRVDDVRLWNGTALTAGEADLEAIGANPAKTGVAYRWDFNGSAMDRGSTGVNGTLHGTITGATLAPDGRHLPIVLTEPAFTNLITSDDFSAWAKSGTPLTPGSVSDPEGGTAAYSVEDNDAGAQEYITRAISFTGDGVKGVVVVFVTLI